MSTSKYDLKYKYKAEKYSKSTQGFYSFSEMELSKKRTTKNLPILPVTIQVGNQTLYIQHDLLLLNRK